MDLRLRLCSEIVESDCKVKSLGKPLNHNLRIPKQRMQSQPGIENTRCSFWEWSPQTQLCWSAAVHSTTSVMKTSGGQNHYLAWSFPQKNIKTSKNPTNAGELPFEDSQFGPIWWPKSLFGVELSSKNITVPVKPGCRALRGRVALARSFRRKNTPNNCGCSSR